MEKCLSENNEYSAPVVSRVWHDLYIDCQANPLDRRSDVQFCEENALDISTFRSWKYKHRKYIFNEVNAKRKTYANELRAAVFKSLAAKLDRDTNAAKLILQALGDLVEKTETKIEMSDADKIRRIQTLMQNAQNKKKQWEVAENGPDSSS